MGGLGTLHNGVAAGDIYGKDCDCLLWDSSMTEKDTDAIGIFGIQALVGMDRAPLLWYQHNKQQVLTKLHELTGADVAVYSVNENIKHRVATPAELENVPWAMKYFNCPANLKDLCGKLRYVGQCWIDRTDFAWEGIDLSYTPKQKQQAEPGGRASWHPGNREHQITARGLTFTILKALHEVLTMWNEAANYEIDDGVWHVTDYYASIKSKVLEHKDEWVGWCENKKIPTKFCAYGAKGRTENTPRARPWATSLRAIMAGSEHPNHAVGPNWYDPPEVYNPALDPPLGELDVLAIVENGVSFRKNLARILDSAQNMEGRDFKEEGTGSRLNLDIVGGKGWQFENPLTASAPDNCDGEYDSWCRRTGSCLMYGHNDGRM